MKKTYDLICKLIETREPLTREMADQMRKELMPASAASTLMATRQLRIVYQSLYEIPTMLRAGQELELSVASLRLFAAIEAEDNAKSCDRCQKYTSKPVAISVGTEQYNCCQSCADHICSEISK